MRIDRLRKYGIADLLPPLNEIEYLANHWRNAGYVMAGGMGPAPLTSQELIAWQQGSGVELNPWEFYTILGMSRKYIAGFINGSEYGAQAPFDIGHVTSSDVDDSIRAIFGSRSRKAK
ncbi:hypothetical protein [Nitrosomonas sp. Nm34]|uniref:hypothetical protein n=1 Tax=Nitrosomonas sp. Nm34 TaxID=1881055 RepID=UPI0008E29310|nr:hypothetical protein [Nitrosomonas sp. Nm34]SFI31500.1 hypothetical protein SAMN05428978_100575 [Nitrosomonas sp. Nm34]